MTFGYLVRAAGLAAIGLALVACSSDSSDDGGGATSTTESTTVAATSEASTPVSTGGGSEGDRGHATLTVGDATWEFDAFSCAFGHDATQSAVYAFSSDARGVDPSGSNVQFQANIRDASGSGNYEGDGVVFELDLNDISNFESPAVGWSATSGRNAAFGGGTAVIHIDGDHVTAEAGFDNTLTDAEFEDVAGTLDATCGAQSRR